MPPKPARRGRDVFGRRHGRDHLVEKGALFAEFTSDVERGVPQELVKSLALLLSHEGPLIGERGGAGVGQRGGPRTICPYLSAASASSSGSIRKPSGRGVARSRPACRNMPSMPPGVQIINRSAVSEVIR